MRMSADDQQQLGVVDIVVQEPADGAHSDHAETAKRLRTVILQELDRLASIPLDDLVALRYQRYRSLGAYGEVDVAVPSAPPPTRPGLTDRLRNLIEAGRGAIPASPLPRRDEPPAREDV
jgi:hypothetical protein